MTDKTTSASPRAHARALTKSSRSTLASVFVVLLLVALVSSELLCKFVIGLGDPPLYQADGTMEYLLQPSKTYHRFHHQIAVNRYAMRADDFPPRSPGRMNCGCWLSATALSMVG